MRPRGWVIAILAAAALGVVVGTSWQGRGRVAPPGAPGPPEALAPAPQPAPQGASQPAPPRSDRFMQIEGTTLSAADPAGRRLWELRARSLEVDSAKQRVVLTAMSGQFYARGGAAQLAFSAPRAVFQMQSRDVDMSGGVVGRAPDGRVLRASRVRWNAARRSIEARGHVVLTQRGVAIQSDALVADAALDQVRLSGNVVVRVTE